MKPMKKHPWILCLLALIPAHAGNINIVHLGANEDLTLQIKCQGKSQQFVLKHGADSGTFIVPNKPATIHVEEKKYKDLTVDTAKTGKIVVLFEEKDECKWQSIESKPQDGKNALRIVNLSTEKASVAVGDQEYAIEPKEEKDAGIINGSSIAMKIVGQKKHSISPEEPGAHIALLYKDGETWNVRFVADH
jgi:hypothetical protein